MERGRRNLGCRDAKEWIPPALGSMICEAREMPRAVLTGQAVWSLHLLYGHRFAKNSTTITTIQITPIAGISDSRRGWSRRCTLIGSLCFCTVGHPSRFNLKSGVEGGKCCSVTSPLGHTTKTSRKTVLLQLACVFLPAPSSAPSTYP